MSASQLLRKMILFALVLSASACGFYNEAIHNPSSATQPFKQGETLGFEVVKTILGRNSCYECHTAARGNRGGVNLESFANAKANASGIAATTLSGFMPIGGQRVSATDQAVLQAWADAGAPETSTLPLPGAGTPQPTPTPTPIPGPTPAPVGLDFAQVKAAIFTPHCISCHSSFGNYARVAARLTEIQRSIDTNFMPRNGPPLSAELKTLLANWISAGAPEVTNGNGAQNGEGGGTQEGRQCEEQENDDDNDDDDCDDNDDDFITAN
jgi:hypothetical protein